MKKILLLTLCLTLSPAAFFDESHTAEIRGIAGKCLDVSGGGSDDGTPIILWPCHGGANQRWGVGEFTNFDEGPSQSRTCAACNDGSCQCGTGTPASLCAGHRGNNPRLGCAQQQ